jgi:16S rRNA (guanine1207-N2)-methyltransferase
LQWHGKPILTGKQTRKKMSPSDHYYSPDPSSQYNITLISTICRNREFEFYSAPGVFSSTRIDTGTLVLLKKAEIPISGRILDLGCGIGIIGIVLYVENSQIEPHFLDINSRATDLTRRNVEKYHIPNASIFTGDCLVLLEDNNIRYNAIYYNPPIRLGKKIYLEHILKATHYLTPNGFMQIVIKKKLGAPSAYSFLDTNLDKAFFEMKVLGKNSGYWIFEIRKLR